MPARVLVEVWDGLKRTLLETSRARTELSPAVTVHDGSAAANTLAENEDKETTRVRKILAALKQSYPDRIDRLEVREGDQAIRVGSEWFYWAHGRLLPELLKGEWEKYDPVPFYHYPSKLPELPEYTAEDRERLARVLDEWKNKPVRRHAGFYNALWRIRDRATGAERVKTTFFLGMKVMVHRELLEDLAAVEEEILSGAREDPALAGFIRSLGKLEGYSWRTIDGTSSLSYHAYGTALDIIPVSYQGKHAYWRWALEASTEWYRLSYADRFMPPEKFVQAFERHGFVWGGKWLFFDTMHFEYRPEILYLNTLPPPS